MLELYVHFFIAIVLNDMLNLEWTMIYVFLCGQQTLNIIYVRMLFVTFNVSWLGVLLYSLSGMI